MAKLIYILLQLLLLVRLSLANVEKVIFTAPSVSSPAVYQSLSHLPYLSPKDLTIRTKLHSAFEHSPAKKSIPSTAWYVLEDLTPGSRYELRVCWAATQPTAWELDVFTEDQIQDRDLLPLTTLGMNKALSSRTSDEEPNTRTGSWLLLKVKAQADYFTMNETLMQEGLIVDVDIILDSYLWNIVPVSLLPTGLHILLVAVVAVLALRILMDHLDSILNTNKGLSDGKKKT